MTQFSQTRLEAILSGFQHTRIAIIGDLMLDRYIFGSVSRISPEAPVPVLEIDHEQARLGGAANVGHNIVGLGATPLMLGVIGDDAPGAELQAIFERLNFPLDGIITDPARPTTVKTRIIAGSQQMLRIDHEVKQPISPDTEHRLIAAIESQIESLSAIILEDYNKGVITKSLIHHVTSIANKHKIPLLVDPKFQNFFEYQHCTVFKPNRNEVEGALSRRLQSTKETIEAGRHLLTELQAENILLTLGERGMMLLERGVEEPITIPTRARQVADVSGAGDTVIATLAVAMACGSSVREAAILANRAAGLVIEELGIVPIYTSQLREAMLEDLQTSLTD